MILSRVADEKSIPWAQDSALGKQESVNESQEINDQHLASLPPSKVDEKVVAHECDRIQKCASNGEAYYCREDWSSAVKSHLFEYALANGMNREQFCPVKVSSNENADMERSAMTKQSQTENGDKQTSSDPMLDELRSAFGDPFKIEEKADMSHMEQKDWEKVDTPTTMPDAPQVALDNSVVPLRGGEDYNANREAGVAPGQNSVAKPEAIDELAENEHKTAGEKLSENARQREEQKEAERKTWEDDKVNAMEKNDIVPQGNVFPTEVMNAQPGLGTSSKQPGIYSDVDANNMPDKTAGEKIADFNEETKKSIQRDKPEDNDWEQPSREKTRSISNTFAESIDKHLGK